MKSKSLEFERWRMASLSFTRRRFMRSRIIRELGLPLGAQLLVLEDDADDFGAVVGRSG